MPLVYQQNINATTRMGLWHIAEDEDFFLSSVPLQRNITHLHKRLQHLAGRLLLIELYPDFPLELIQIADTRKPFLPDEPFHFSISHCGDYAAAIVSRDHRVGVDIELPAEKIRRLAAKFTGAEEEQFLIPDQFIQRATLIWSVKETVFKWYGNGGVDFREDIVIKNISGDEVEGFAHCEFRDNTALRIHYLHFNGNYLTWLLTDS